MNYKDMLKNVREELPESVFEKDRFQIPKVKGHIQGNRTVLKNFLQIASHLGRESQHLLKFILKELATPGEVKKSGSVMIGRKVNATLLNEKIRQYAEEFVFCQECGKPDTKLEKEGAFVYMKCTACGARHTVKARI